MYVFFKQICKYARRREGAKLDGIECLIEDIGAQIKQRKYRFPP
jgi:hypothetical protein